MGRCRERGGGSRIAGGVRRTVMRKSGGKFDSRALRRLLWNKREIKLYIYILLGPTLLELDIGNFIGPLSFHCQRCQNPKEILSAGNFFFFP